MENKTQDSTLDLSNEVPINKHSPPTKVLLEHTVKTRIAYKLLIGIFVIFILAFIAEVLAKLDFMDSDASKSFLIVFREDLIPIITLLIGYFFGQK